jgi:L,D-transpeptidase catalytic domain
MRKVIPLLLIILLIFVLTGVKNDRVFSKENTSWTYSTVFQLYQDIQGNEFSFKAFENAYYGFKLLENQRLLENDTILTIIDYSRPSSEERLFIIDLKNCRVQAKSLVAHGQATGDILPERFSNNPHSHESCLGFFITDEVYLGKNGYSLKLRGIEKNINDNAEKRSIVFHGADYVSFNYLREYGRLGRSFGCPALPPEKNHCIIDQIRNKSCVFIYYPADDYLTKSKLINGAFLQTASE